mmetsp:Transcript_29553/g.47671  ORF Transcript_29553/g.47671 Transcript_29553/m.47671 type:complete len:1219 (+) Transcript_29553:1027-4683(+)
MASVWVQSGQRKDLLLRRKALEEAQAILMDCAVGTAAPFVVPDQAKFVKESEKQIMRLRQRTIAVVFFVLAVLSAALAVAVFYAISTEIAKRDAQFAYGVANAEKLTSQRVARENLYQFFGQRSAGYVSNKRTALGLLAGVETMRVMQNESIPNLYSTMQAHREAMSELGADWVYQGSVAYDVIPVISRDGNTMAFLANSSMIVLVSGLSTHVYRQQYISLGPGCTPMSEYTASRNQYIVQHNFLRLSQHGTVVILGLNLIRGKEAVRTQDNTSLCVADLRAVNSYGSIYEALPIAVGAFADVYISDSGVVVVASSTTDGSQNNRLSVWSSVDEFIARNGSVVTAMTLGSSSGAPFPHLIWGATFLDCTDPTSHEHFLVTVENSVRNTTSNPNRVRIHAFKPRTADPLQWPKGNPIVEIDAPYTDPYTYFADMDPIWFVKRHDSTCTWITDAVGHYQLNAPALFNDESPPSLGTETISSFGAGLKDSSGKRCAVPIVFPFAETGEAIGPCNTEMVLVDLPDFSVRGYIANYVLLAPFSATGFETVAIVQSNADLFWSPTGVGNSRFLDRPKFGSLHLSYPRYLVPNGVGTNLVSFADDGVAAWNPSYGVSSRSPLVTSRFPCDTNFQLPFLSHGAEWTVYICVSLEQVHPDCTSNCLTRYVFGDAFLTSDRHLPIPVPLTKVYGDNHLFEWVEYETASSHSLFWNDQTANQVNVPNDSPVTLALDIYTLPLSQNQSPVMTHRLEKVTNSPIQFKGDRLVCKNWLLFQDCLLYVRTDGSVPSDCSVDLSRLYAKDSCNCSGSVLARVQYTEDCSKVLVVSQVPVCPCDGSSSTMFRSAIVSLHEDGTASDIILDQPDNLESSVLLLSKNPTFEVMPAESSANCAYESWVVSPNGNFLASVCYFVGFNVIEGVVSLFNLTSTSSYSSAVPIASFAFEGVVSYSEVSFSKLAPVVSFGPNSQYMSLQRGQELSVWDLTRTNISADPLVLSTRQATVDLSSMYSRTRLLSYPYFTVDSHYLITMEFYEGKYDAWDAPVYAVHPSAHTAAACRVAGRDASPAEWLAVGLGEKDHPICPGPFYERGTCFGVPNGGTLRPDGVALVIDTCSLTSYSFALQLAFVVSISGGHVIHVRSAYDTDVGVYSSSCATLAYVTTPMSVNVPSLSKGDQVNVIVSSHNGDKCGIINLSVEASPFASAPFPQALYQAAVLPSYAPKCGSGHIG